MTMHVVLGDGEMTRRELTAALADLWKADTAEDQSFWFLVQGKPEPSDTDKALVSWMEANEVYYEVVTDDPESMSDIYTQPQEVHTAKKLKEKVVGLLQSKPEEDEPAEVLALFFDVNDPAAAEDRWLNGIIQGAYNAGFTTRALNDGLVEIDLTEAPPEETPAEEAPQKTNGVAKKAAPRTPVSEEDATPPAPAADSSASIEIPDRAELEAMEPSEVKELAATLGITLPPRTRVTTYIDQILGEGKALAEVVPIVQPEADYSEQADEAAALYGANTNGHIDYDKLADMLADIVAGKLWERIRQVASSV